METRMQRADIQAPSTPEQYRAALDRQERVIHSLRENLNKMADERDILGAAILRAVINTGGIEDGHTLDGPQLLMALDGLAEHANYMASRCTRIEAAAMSEGAGPALRAAINENPAASLAHVRAQAIDYAVDQCEHVQYGQCPHAIEVETLIKFAASIRKGDNK